MMSDRNKIKLCVRCRLGWTMRHLVLGPDGYECADFERCEQRVNYARRSA